MKRSSINKLWRNREGVVIGGYFGALIYAIFILVPIYFLIISSFKDNAMIYASPLGFPDSMNLDNFLLAIKRANLQKALVSTIITVFGSEAIILLLAFPAAYAIARIESRFNAIIELIFGLGLLIPAFAMMVPVFLTMANLKLLYSAWSLIIFYPATSLSLSVILLATNLREIPKEIEESARLDGATLLETLVHIILPLARPGIATVIILSFLSIWNEFLFALILLNSKTSHNSSGNFNIKTRTFA